MLQKFCIPFLIFFITASAQGQKVIISGIEANRPLTWDDFTGKIDKSSDFEAFTAYRSSWKMRGAKASGDSALIEGFEISVEFDAKKSWVNKAKATPALLVHEQGHFNMGIIAVREIMETFQKTKFKLETYRDELRNMISNIVRKYHALELTYDRETDHSKNAEMQTRWNVFFSSELASPRP